MGTDYTNSMLFPYHSSTFPPITGTPSFPLPVSSLWHRSPHRHGIRPSSPNRVCFSHRSMPTVILEQEISRYGGSDRYDICAHSGRYRDVFRDEGRGSHAWERV